MSAVRVMPRELVTDRLTLSPWTESDADDHRALVAERSAGAATADGGGRAASQRAAAANTGLSPYVVRRRERNDDFIGYCGLIVGRSTPEEPEIVFELHRWAHGSGYATEAACAVVDAAAGAGWRRLWATVATSNTASFRVLDKLGFERDRVAEDESGEFVWLTRRLG